MILEKIVSFPCGYKISQYLEVSSLAISFNSSNYDEYPICPLHGKKCKGVRK